jgi:Tfp pilus assembly protein PilF
MAAGWARAGGGSDSWNARNPDFARAEKPVEAGDYAGAVLLLRDSVAADPANADAHNLLGFGHRKLGDVGTALIHYVEALALKPKRRGANEYLGALNLDLGQLDKARGRLDVLDEVCFFGCQAYRELKAEIETYQAQSAS